VAEAVATRRTDSAPRRAEILLPAPVAWTRAGSGFDAARPPRRLLPEAASAGSGQGPTPAVRLIIVASFSAAAEAGRRDRLKADPLPQASARG
jgi:hypothetical protein